jgi:hypothetical protein
MAPCHTDAQNDAMAYNFTNGSGRGLFRQRRHCFELIEDLQYS